VFTFNNGTLKMNETDVGGYRDDPVTSDSIFRIMSVSKNVALSSAFAVSNLQNQTGHLRLGLDTPLRMVLPEFSLPERDWNDGGSEITLGMLASHTAGVPREVYSTGFNMILSTSKGDGPTIGAEWASVTAQEVVSRIATTKLMFAPGKRAAYSNAGAALVGVAAAAYYNNMSNTSLSWSEMTTKQVLKPLNMTHSFFGHIPQPLKPFIAIPGGNDNWADLLVGEGYNPTAGMWSSANDLSRYLHALWLSPSPSLITKYQRRRSLKPAANLPDGVQQAAPGWEVYRLTLNTSANTSIDSAKTYSVYGKSGDGGGYHSWIDLIPNLGYGIVVLTQQSSTIEGYASLNPQNIRDIAHEILAPAFAKALAARAAARFAGTYALGQQDTGLYADVVNTTATTTGGHRANTTTTTTTYARLEVKDQILYVRELVVNGTSALEALDRLGWSGNKGGPRLWSTEQGAMLVPSEGAAEHAEFGAGSQVFRAMFPGLSSCDWFDYDGLTDSRGWPLEKVVLVEEPDGGGTVELRYPPFDVVVRRG
jgi:CubicO group peptidase (beta-lactamase class C family)